MILLSELTQQFEQMSDRELRDVCRVLMPIIGKRFRTQKTQCNCTPVAVHDANCPADSLPVVPCLCHEPTTVCRACGSAGPADNDNPNLCVNCAEDNPPLR